MLRAAGGDGQGVRGLGQVQRGNGREVAVGRQRVHSLRDELAAGRGRAREGGGSPCVSVQASLAVGMQAARENSCILKRNIATYKPYQGEF